jgi:hypothetical protein
MFMDSRSRGGHGGCEIGQPVPLDLALAAARMAATAISRTGTQDGGSLAAQCSRNACSRPAEGPTISAVSSPMPRDIVGGEHGRILHSGKGSKALPPRVQG